MKLVVGVKMRKIAFIAGMVIVVGIIGFFLFHPAFQKSQDSCPPPPTSLFRIINTDSNKSHTISVTIKDSSNLTMARELYDLLPAADITSGFKFTNESGLPYYLDFLVDDTVPSTISVYPSYHHIPELHVEPEQKTVMLYRYLLNGDYGCNISGSENRKDHELSEKRT